MLTQQKCKCDQCGMVFPSSDNLFKHKTRFCIGVEDSGIGRKPVDSDDENVHYNKNDNYNRRSPVRRIIRHQSSATKVNIFVS